MNPQPDDLSPNAAEKLARMPSNVVAYTVRFAVARGVPWDRITAETGLGPADVLRADTWLPGSIVPIVWRLVAELCPGDAPALDLARAAPLDFLGDILGTLRFGRTLRQILEMAVQFKALISDGMILELVDRDDEARLRFGHVADSFDRGYGAEAGIGVAWRVMTDALGDLDGVVRVEFAHAPNGPETRYVDYFRVPVVFGRPSNGVVFTAEALDRPLRRHDPTLMRFAEAHREALHEKLRLLAPADGLAAVRQAIERIAEAADYSAEALARRMGMSLRSLQRHVGEHGTTVSELLQTARTANACALLGDRRSSIDEVAEAVGYADRRAFSRAFKRWTGQTPAAFRKSR